MCYFSSRNRISFRSSWPCPTCSPLATERRRLPAPPNSLIERPFYLNFSLLH